MQAYPNLKAIVAPTTVGIAAAARYISTSSSKGKVAVTGLGTPNQMRAYIKDGTVKEFALWNPGDLGYLAAYAAKALVDGTITGKEGKVYQRRTAFAMEPQHFPDSPNKPAFPSVVLKPGEIYKNTIIYRFSAK